MAGNSTESGRSVTSKITSILMTFTEGSEHSLTEIARLAGLPMSTAHRLTSELASWRLLERTDDGPLPGRPAAAHDRHGDAVAAQRRRAGPVGARRPRGRHPQPRPARRAGGPGGRLHREAARSPPGVVLLPRGHAARPRRPRWAGRCSPSPPPTSSNAVLTRGLRAYTPHTVTSPDRFRRALAVTRLTRVAVTRWELEPGRVGRRDAGVRAGRRRRRGDRARRRGT